MRAGWPLTGSVSGTWYCGLSVVALSPTSMPPDGLVSAMYTVVSAGDSAGAQLMATPVKLGSPAAAAAVIQVERPSVASLAIPLDRCAGVEPVTLNPKYTDPSGPAVSGVVICTALSYTDRCACH